MEKEVEVQEKDLTKESIYETLLKTNSFKVPNVTVKEQAELMRKDALNENRANGRSMQAMIYSLLIHLWKMLKKE